MCACDKSCQVGKYLDYEHCKCRKRLIDKLIAEWSENIDKTEVIYNNTLNDYKSCDVGKIIAEDKSKRI